MGKRKRDRTSGGKSEMTGEVLSPIVSRKSANQIWNARKAAIKADLPALPPNVVVNDQGSSSYPYHNYADFWQSGRPLSSGEFWPTRIELQDSDTADPVNLCLLTTRQLPFPAERWVIDEKAAYVGHSSSIGKEGVVEMIKSSRTIELDERGLTAVMEYTLRVMRSQTRKPLKGSVEESDWLLLPIQAPTHNQGSIISTENIDWEEVDSPSVRLAGLPSISLLMINLNTRLNIHHFNDQFFDASMDSELLLRAMTTASVTTDPSRSYERLEWLGDTILKLILTADMMCSKDILSEDIEHLQIRRHVRLSNRTLQVAAITAGIVPFIQATRQRVKGYLPRGWRIDNPDSPKPKPDVQILGGKPIADVVEALIAVAYLSSGKSLDAAISAIRILKIPMDHIRKWSDVKLQAPSPVIRQPVGEEESWMLAFRPPPATLLGYVFRERHGAEIVMSLDEAVLKSPAKARYTLFGDAIIDYFHALDIWTNNPDQGPSGLTVIRSSRRHSAASAAFCVTFDLVNSLKDVPSKMTREIKQYKKSILAARDAADAEIQDAALGQSSPGAGRDWWLDAVHMPILAGIPEAVLGAILEDSGYDIETTRKVFTDRFLPFSQKYCALPSTQPAHPKARLLEWIARNRCTKCKVEQVNLRSNDEGTDHDAGFSIHDIVVCKETATTQEVAIRRVCSSALVKLAQEPEILDRLCDCFVTAKKRGDSSHP